MDTGSTDWIANSSAHICSGKHSPAGVYFYGSWVNAEPGGNYSKWWVDANQS